MSGQYLFVQHLKGEVEGTKYDKVKLSDGIRVFSIKNETGQSDFLEKGFIPEKTRVDCTFRITSSKELATITLKEMKAVKV